MLLCGYSRHPEMAILVIDPQGEFSKDFKGLPSSGGYSFPLREVLQAQGRTASIHTVRNLVLDRWELFEEIFFETEFFRVLSMPKGDNRRVACNVLVEQLKKKKVTLARLHEESAFEVVMSALSDETIQKQIYPSAESRSRFSVQLEQSNRDDLFHNHWRPVGELFRAGREGAITAEQLLSGMFRDKQRRPIIVLDLSLEVIKDLFWNDKIQALVIKRILDGLSRAAEYAYKDGESLNALVVIDEAHRLAPKGSGRNNASSQMDIREVLVDAARTTRKYGLGWLFISQTLSSIDSEIVQQLRIMFFGFGLSMGQEYRTLQELAGSSSSALDLYRLFRDPHSAFDLKSRQYSFMSIGPVSPLSFASTPLFFNAFNSVEGFLQANSLQLRRLAELRAISSATNGQPNRQESSSSPSAQPVPFTGFGDEDDIPF